VNYANWDGGFSYGPFVGGVGPYRGFTLFTRKKKNSSLMAIWHSLAPAR